MVGLTGPLTAAGLVLAWSVWSTQSTVSGFILVGSVVFWGRRAGRYTTQFDNEMTSVRSFVAGLLPGSSAASAVYLAVAMLGGLGAVALWWRNRNDARHFTFLLSAILCINLLLAPYVRSYDFCLLLVPLLYNLLVIRKEEKIAQPPPRFHWSLLWYALIIIPWPLHVLAINKGVFALENIISAALLVITAFVWRNQKTSPLKEVLPDGKMMN